MNRYNISKGVKPVPVVLPEQPSKKAKRSVREHSIVLINETTGKRLKINNRDFSINASCTTNEPLIEVNFKASFINEVLKDFFKN